MRLGVYVGSFNPVHIGHIDVANYLINNNYIDKVLIIPTLEYWDKQNLAPLNDRINMLKLLETDLINIDNKHNSYNYTCDLMKALSNELDDELYLIIGADNIINFDKWKNYKDLLKYKIIVMKRGNIDSNGYIEKFNTNNFIVVDDYEYIDISSTDIRNGNNKYLNPKVLKYIKENNLYGNCK